MSAVPSIRQYFSYRVNVSLMRTLILVLMLNVASLGSAAASTEGGKVLICTSSGYQWIDADSQQSTQANGSHCVFCLNFEGDVDGIQPSYATTLRQRAAICQSRIITRLVLSPSLNPLHPLRAPPATLEIS